MHEDNKKIGINPLIEYGDTGLNHQGNYIYEEYERDLQGLKSGAAFREMADNDPIVGAFLTYVDLLTRQMAWTVSPADDSPKAQEIADQLQQDMGNMNLPWGDIISEMYSMLVFGYSIQEIVLEEADHGRLKWAKFAPRAQETNDGWKINDAGDATHFIQRTLIKPRIEIPLEKCLHFVHRNRKNNPEGYSALRTAYTSYATLRKLKWIEAVGYERNVTGMPIFEVPPEMLSKNADTQDQAMVKALFNIVRQIKRNDREGAVIPSEIDLEGKPTGYKLRFATNPNGAQAQAAIHQAIIRYEQRLAISLMSEFTLLGSSGTGSHAMHDDKTNHFVLALEAVADNITSTINKTAVSKLMELNGIAPELWPRIHHGNIKERDLESFSKFITPFLNSTILTPDQKTEDYIRQIGGLPALDSDKEVL